MSATPEVKGSFGPFAGGHFYTLIILSRAKTRSDGRHDTVCVGLRTKVKRCENKALDPGKRGRGTVDDATLTQ